MNFQLILRNEDVVICLVAEGQKQDRIIDQIVSMNARKGFGKDYLHPKEHQTQRNMFPRTPLPVILRRHDEPATPGLDAFDKRWIDIAKEILSNCRNIGAQR